MQQKFVEFQGVIINLDQVKLCQKSIDKDKIKKEVDEGSGVTKEIIEGKPFLITFDLGGGVVVNFAYTSREDRDINYDRWLDILEARQK